MKAVKFVFVSIFIFANGFEAAAIAINFPRAESEIQVRAKDLIVKEEKPYHCVLKGRPESKWSFSDSLEVDVTAESLQGAAELAFTPFMVLDKADQKSEVVKIKVDGEHFFVREIHCKLVQRSI